MIVYLMRHGEADDNVNDDLRALTEKGRRRSKKMARLAGKLRLPRPEAVVASPLVRAQQTAVIAAEELAPATAIETNSGLKPSSSLEAAMSVIAAYQSKVQSLLLVGHDPLFSLLASAILTGQDRVVISMGKSAIAVFEITRFEVPRMRGALHAYLPPSLSKED